MGSIDVDLDAVTTRLVHPTSPVLLTRNGPLGATIFSHVQLRYEAGLIHLKFENRLRVLHSQDL